MNLQSKLFKTPLLGIIELSSEITKAFFNRCITTSGEYKGSDVEEKKVIYAEKTHSAKEIQNLYFILKL